MDLLDKYLYQTFRYVVHSNIGFLIGFDYRKSVSSEIRTKTVSERTQFTHQGNKFVCKMIILGNLDSPSE